LAGSAASKPKSTAHKSTGKKKGASAKKASQTAMKTRNRRLWGFVLLVLTLLSSLALLNADGFLIRWYYNLTTGLVGQGYYLLPIAFFAAALLLLLKKRPRVAGRVGCLLAMPVLYGAFAHLYFAGEEAVSLGALYETGKALSSGGVVAGFIGGFLKSALSLWGAAVFLILLFIAAVFFAFNIKVDAFAAWWKGLFHKAKGRFKVDYADDEVIQMTETAADKKRAPASFVPTEVGGKMPSIDISLKDEPLPAGVQDKGEKGRSIPLRPASVPAPGALLRAESPAPADKPETLPVVDPAPPVRREPAVDLSTPVVAAEQLDLTAPLEKAVEETPEEEKSSLPETPTQTGASISGAPPYYFPPLSLLAAGDGRVLDPTEELKTHSARLLDTLQSFNIEASIVNITRGPSVTRYEIQLNRGTKYSRLTSLSDDIALSLGASSVRIAPIPDKVAIGIEVPNQTVQTVYIREVIDSAAFKNAKSRVSFAVGRDIAGNCIVGDIAKMPHMLIAGTTGSGKSVCINSLLVSLLYKSTPEEVRLIMIDPKMVELGGYNGIPHLLIPVVTDPKKAAGALNWAVGEMMRRYKLFSDQGAKDITSYNALMRGREDGVPLPQVVIVIDELADLMMVAAGEVEEAICRIGQMARAAGMHLIVATQRPSSDVITGLMKANIPSRIAFAVASQIESRIILDQTGAEKLIGRGDMLFSPLGLQKPLRVQGCLISGPEVEAVVDYIKRTGSPDYSEEVMEHIEKHQEGKNGSSSAAGDSGDDADELLPAAIEVVVETGQASASLLQRRLKLGYSRAARLVDQMEERGIVGPYEGSKPRTLLITKEQWQEMALRQSE